MTDIIKIYEPEWAQNEPSRVYPYQQFSILILKCHGQVLAYKKRLESSSHGQYLLGGRGSVSGTKNMEMSRTEADLMAMNMFI